MGVALPQQLGGIDIQTFLHVMDINVRVAVQITQALIGNMKSRGWGRIVNVCSRAIYGAIDRTAYSAAKSALVGCTRTWALELAQFGISLLMVEEARENVRNVQKLCGNRQTPIQGCNLILSLLVRYF